MTKRRRSQMLTLVALSATAAMLSGCKIRQGMWDQPKYEPMEASAFFDDGASAQQPVEGTVARGTLKEDEHFYTGLVNGEPAKTFPFEITEAVLRRGQERFEIYCTPCHDRTGSGNGMVVQRGYKRPASYHIDRLWDAEPGYFFKVMTEGFGVMPSYSYQVKPEDRWAIAAYIRVLQFSQHAPLAELPAELQARLRDASAANEAHAGETHE